MAAPAQKTNNQATLTSDGIICIVYRGPENYQTITAMAAETERLAQQLQRQGRPVKLATDVSGVTSQTVGARKAGLEIIRRLHLDAIAVCGGTKFIKYLAIFFLRASGHPKAQYFDTLEAGLQWLKQL